MVNEPAVNAETSLLPEVRRRLADQFAITHITVQCELEPCHRTDEEHHFTELEPDGGHERSGAHDHGDHKH